MTPLERNLADFGQHFETASHAPFFYKDQNRDLTIEHNGSGRLVSLTSRTTEPQEEWRRGSITQIMLEHTQTGSASPVPEMNFQRSTIKLQVHGVGMVQIERAVNGDNEATASVTHEHLSDDGKPVKDEWDLEIMGEAVMIDRIPSSESSGDSLDDEEIMWLVSEGLRMSHEEIESALSQEDQSLS